MLAAGPACATEVYRWVDADGVVHFSQTAPAPTVEGVSRETVAGDAPPESGPDRDIYDVAGQQARMQALHAEREAQRAERRRRAQQAAAQRPAVDEPREHGYPVYWAPPGRPRPPVRPTPPIERPVPSVPLKPPGDGGPAGGGA